MHRKCLLLCTLFWIVLASSEANDATPQQESLLERVVKLNCIQEPELDTPSLRAQFNSLVQQARNELAGKQTPREKIAALNKVLLTDREVSYLSNLYWRDATLAASLLRKKGNCLSTTTLYVLVGDALGLPIKMVRVPQHVFARWDDNKVKINIETTNGGVEVADKTYLSRAASTPEDVEALGWCTSLDRNGFLAELTQTAAHHREGENRLKEALRLLDDVEKLTPGRPEVQLRRIIMQADLTAERQAARQQIRRLLAHGSLPPSLGCSALLWLAHESAAEKDFQLERRMLLEAFRQAPKSEQLAILQSLAFCHRSLKDYRGAARYMELAIVLVADGDTPTLAGALYNLAILQKNDARLGDALASIRAALKLNPESWNLQMIEAGYMVLNGEREAGLKRFEAIRPPKGDADFYNSMLAWFCAVSRQREKFYTAFEHALSASSSPHMLVWIEQDVDLDVYRNEPEFKALVEKCRQRLLGHQNDPVLERRKEAAPAQ